MVYFQILVQMSSIIKISTLLFFLFVVTINAQAASDAETSGKESTMHTTIHIETIKPLLVNWIYAEFNVSCNDYSPGSTDVIKAYKLKYHPIDSPDEGTELKWDDPELGNFKGVEELGAAKPGGIYNFSVEVIYSDPKVAPALAKYTRHVTLPTEDFVPTFTVINETNSLNISRTRQFFDDAKYFIYNVSEIQSPEKHNTPAYVNSTTNNCLVIAGLEPNMDYEYRISRCIRLKPTICSSSVNVTGHTKSAAGLKSMEINILTTISLVFYCLINQF